MDRDSFCFQIHLSPCSKTLNQWVCLRGGQTGQLESPTKRVGEMEAQIESPTKMEEVLL